MYIVALNGSHNDEGNTAYLLNAVLEKCKKRGAETEMINVYKAVSDAKYPFCVNCSNPCSKHCYAGTLLEEAYGKVTKADFVIIGSPVYFGSMTAQLKAFFDKTRAIRGEKKWLAKPMAAVTVGASKYGGQERTLEAIHSCALVLGMTVVGSSGINAMGHFGVSAQRPACEDEYAKGAVENLAERIYSECCK
mgnify:CR=1 FL=1